MGQFRRFYDAKSLDCNSETDSQKSIDFKSSGSSHDI